jgi:hypothetical protein
MLDMSVEALTPSAKPWRPYGVGTSELAKLFLALGRRPRDIAPRWLRDETEPQKRRAGVSRYLLEKAGRLSRLKKTSAAQSGIDREAELWCTWAEGVEVGDPGPLDLDPHSPLYAGGLPREWPPLCDVRFSPRLVARVDGWARTRSGELVTVSLKCARYGFNKPAWWNGITEAPWYYDLQAQGEMAITGARHGLLVVGCGWIRDEDDPREDAEILVLRIPRKDALITEIRDAVAEGWAEIERLRAA